MLVNNKFNLYLNPPSPFSIWRRGCERSCVVWDEVFKSKFSLRSLTLSCSLKYIFVALLFLTFFFSNAQKKSYDGLGSVSEIIMASPAEIRGHFDLFFESCITLDNQNKEPYWYKIVFNDSCWFDLTLFPLYESDHYAYKVFKSDNNLKFCQAVVDQKVQPVNDIKKERVYKDKDQSEAFRANLLYTKKVFVKQGEAVYIAIENIWGKDLGHILGVNTCDYSYVLQVTKKRPAQADTTSVVTSTRTELSDERALAAIGAKLCPVDGMPVKLGSIKFNEAAFNVSNNLYINGDQKDRPVNEPVIIYKKNPLPMIADTVSTTPAVVAEANTENKTEQIVNHPESEAKIGLNNLVPVKCIISDAQKGFGIDAPPVIAEEASGKKIQVKKIHAGEYEVLIEKNKNYRTECATVGYKKYEKTINIYKSLRGEGNEFEIKLNPFAEGDNFVLNNIYFHTNTPVIKKDSNKELEQLYQYMKNNTDAIISIEGHTNSNRFIQKDKRRQRMGGKWAFHGTAKKLSKNRANEVRSYLSKKGIDGERVKTKGWGGNKELYPNAKTLDQSYKNMRVEVVILKI